MTPWILTENHMDHFLHGRFYLKMLTILYISCIYVYEKVTFTIGSYIFVVASLPSLTYLVKRSLLKLLLYNNENMPTGESLRASMKF